MEQQYNRYTAQLDQKTNWFLYMIIVVISLIILMFLTIFLSLAISFASFITFGMYYLSFSISSFIIGLITALILNKVAKTNRAFLLGGSIISFLTAIVVSITLLVKKELATQIRAVYGGLMGLFGETPNSLLAGILIIIFFNIFFLILFFRKEQKSMKDLMVYLYGFIIFLIIYFAIPSIYLLFK